MTSRPARATINNSRLIQALSDLELGNPELPPQNFAEKLGQFLNFSDAITLSSALERPLEKKFETTNIPQRSLEEEFLQTRNMLVTSVVRSCSGDQTTSRIRMPTVKIGEKFNPQSAFDAYLRFYATHQQNLDTHVRTLRANLRNLLAAESAHGKKLATLDAALDDIFWARSRASFANVPKLLEKRFNTHYEMHLQDVELRGIEDASTEWMQPKGWLFRFCAEMQTLLLAELDVRLQPALGLVEAYNKEVKTIS